MVSMPVSPPISSASSLEEQNWLYCGAVMAQKE